MAAAEHIVGHAVVIVVTAVAMILMFMMNVFKSSNLIPGLYQYVGFSELSDKYIHEITPAGITFSIWGLIYFWQVLFISYGLSTIFRQWPDGYLYCSPKIMPVGIYLSYIASCAFNVMWLVLFDREMMVGALIVIVLMWITLFIPLVISHVALHDNLETLEKHNMMRETWMIRFLVQNALAVYCTWISVATLLNLTIVLTYGAGVDVSLASSTCLGILCGSIMFWLILDFTVFCNYTLYLFSPHLVFLIALAGILGENLDLKNQLQNSIILIEFIAVATIAFIFKVFVMIRSACCMHRNRPLEQAVEKAPIPE